MKYLKPKKLKKGKWYNIGHSSIRVYCVHGKWVYVDLEVNRKNKVINIDINEVYSTGYGNYRKASKKKIKKIKKLIKKANR